MKEVERQSEQENLPKKNLTDYSKEQSQAEPQQEDWVIGALSRGIEENEKKLRAEKGEKWWAEYMELIRECEESGAFDNIHPKSDLTPEQLAENYRIMMRD